MQEQFIKFLKGKTQDNTSFVDEVAGVLDIGYDAAYRRINLKTSLTLEEGVKLARHYKVSLNKLFEVGNTNTLIAELPPQPKDELGLEMWLKASLDNVSTLIKLKNCEIIYSAKDIPFFHTLNDSNLSRYKMYVWLKDLNTDMAKSKITFDDWVETIPDSLLQSAYNLSAAYKYIDITELWNDNTVTGTLQQVLYYFEAGLVSKEMALSICEDINDVINHTEEQTIQQSLFGAKNKNSYHLYKCDLHMLTNTVMVKTPFQKVFFSPFTVLSYFKIEHQETCEMMHDFLQKQMSISKLLATAGERDRTLFFKTIHQKINTVKAFINLDDKMTFL
ncbi:hypothetical protein [Aestuariivivens sediminicola]|uniref:hypothetical protein n=1 Tax=Aestuariivivens sediminicola TaxID=2913560 RepID=UPI001F565BBD|nr:hypothetical protein [Aestuariivivens sediminicola]